MESENNYQCKLERFNKVSIDFNKCDLINYDVIKEIQNQIQLETELKIAELKIKKDIDINIEDECLLPSELFNQIQLIKDKSINLIAKTIEIEKEVCEYNKSIIKEETNMEFDFIKDVLNVLEYNFKNHSLFEKIQLFDLPFIKKNIFDMKLININCFDIYFKKSDEIGYITINIPKNCTRYLKFNLDTYEKVQKFLLLSNGNYAISYNSYNNCNNLYIEILESYIGIYDPIQKKIIYYIMIGTARNLDMIVFENDLILVLEKMKDESILKYHLFTACLERKTLSSLNKFNENKTELLLKYNRLLFNTGSNIEKQNFLDSQNIIGLDGLVFFSANYLRKNCLESILESIISNDIFNDRISFVLKFSSNSDDKFYMPHIKDSVIINFEKTSDRFIIFYYCSEIKNMYADDTSFYLTYYDLNGKIVISHLFCKGKYKLETTKESIIVRNKTYGNEEEISVFDKKNGWLLQKEIFKDINNRQHNFPIFLK